MSARGGKGTVVNGFCVLDLVLALALATMTMAVAVPLAARGMDVTRAYGAATAMATRIRLTRMEALKTGRATALVFDPAGADWQVRLCVAATGGGVRRADLLSGVASCPGGPWMASRLFPGMTVAADPVPGPGGEPPPASPVRFGASDMVSCTPVGGCTPGSLFLRSKSGDAFVVRVGGTTGRTRVLRYDAGLQAWRPL